MKSAPMGMSWPGFGLYFLVVAVCVTAWTGAMVVVPLTIALHEALALMDPAIEEDTVEVLDIESSRPLLTDNGRREIGVAPIVRVRPDSAPGEARSLLYPELDPSWAVGTRLRAYVPAGQPEFACVVRARCEPTPMWLALAIVWLAGGTFITFRVGRWVRREVATGSEVRREREAVARAG